METILGHPQPKSVSVMPSPKHMEYSFTWYVSHPLNKSLSTPPSWPHISLTCPPPGTLLSLQVSCFNDFLHPLSALIFNPSHLLPQPSILIHQPCLLVPQCSSSLGPWLTIRLRNEGSRLREEGEDC
ncbi:hypothetical protein XELAEV_18032194mg [Xenopus laevis]|uniref:Uncharacterized protein n=1 Tax=Xenopus laevis TaxID=8355 RepID=A0A974CRC1_XENLA|nr:hypothetical protein XELAEV_18032194mg [Xenopus laevis]